MQSYTFNIDQKITMWTRSTKHIEAETYQEAIQILKNQYQAGEMFESLDEYEYLHDTQQDMDVVEVLDTDGNQINFGQVDTTKNENDFYILGHS
jgi:hypothetical protein